MHKRNISQALYKEVIAWCMPKPCSGWIASLQVDCELTVASRTSSEVHDNLGVVCSVARTLAGYRPEAITVPELCFRSLDPGFLAVRISASRIGRAWVKGGISAITTTSLDFVSNDGFERFMGLSFFFRFVVLLNDRFWGCLKSQATVPSLKRGSRSHRRGRRGTGSKYLEWPNN